MLFHRVCVGSFCSDAVMHPNSSCVNTGVLIRDASRCIQLTSGTPDISREVMKGCQNDWETQAVTIFNLAP